MKKIQFRARDAGLGFAALGLLGACTMESASEEAENVGEVREALSSTLHHWSKGQAALDLGSTNGRMCFLTSVGGKLEGGGEWVAISSSGGKWWLNGASQQNASLSASARCIPRARSAHGDWVKGAPPKTLQRNGTCFLTGVQGQFNGGGESVKIIKSGSDWVLSGTSQAPGSLWAASSCVSDSAWVTESAYGPSGSDVRIWDDFQDPPRFACGLQGIKGAFEGGGEHVSVNFVPSLMYWWLVLRSQQGNIGGWASCIT